MESCSRTSPGPGELPETSHAKAICSDYTFLLVSRIIKERFALHCNAIQCIIQVIGKHLFEPFAPVAEGIAGAVRERRKTPASHLQETVLLNYPLNY